jgi:NAD+ synthase (glutamine-hydrolysing)
VLAQGSQFSLEDVEVQTAVVDLGDIWAFRTSRSRGMQAQDPKVHRLERIAVDYRLCKDTGLKATQSMQVRGSFLTMSRISTGY